MKIHIQIGDHLFGSETYYHEEARRDREDYVFADENPHPEIHNHAFAIDLDHNAMLQARRFMEEYRYVTIYYGRLTFLNVIIGQIGYNGAGSPIEIRCSQTELKYLDSKLDRIYPRYLDISLGKLCMI